MARSCLQLLCIVTWTFLATLSSANASEQWADDSVPYKKGDVVPVTCLNRTIDTGEHVTDAQGNLQYIPFPTCAETSLPLSFHYLFSRPQNCTISLTDELFHLLAFYIHNDAPLTCRLPIRNLHKDSKAPKSKAATTDSSDMSASSYGGESPSHVRLMFALSGTLQRSHLHVANSLNVVLHTAAAAGRKGKHTTTAGMRKVGAIDSGVAYSVTPESANQRIVIGDELTFQLDVRWFEGNGLPKAVVSSGGSWFSPLLFGLVVGFGVCYVWVRGAAGHRNGLGGILPGRTDPMLPKYNGYGYGIGNGGRGLNSGYGGGPGKKD